MFYVLEPKHVNPYFEPLKRYSIHEILGYNPSYVTCARVLNLPLSQDIQFFITNHIFVWSWFNGLHAKPHGSVNHLCAWSPLHYETLFIFNHIIFHVNFSNVLGFFRSTKVNQHPHWIFHFLGWSFIKIKLNPRNVWFWLKELDFD
jgi:hypothetical protein